MLPGNSQLSSGRGGTALAWGHLCASRGLASLCRSTMMWCRDDKEAQSYLSMHCHKRANILFLLWKISGLEDGLLEVCPVAWPLISAWPPISGLLKPGKPQHIFSRDACSETRLCATACVLWREDIKCMFSFPGAEAPVPSSAWQCWPHWSKPDGGQ